MKNSKLRDLYQKLVTTSGEELFGEAGKKNPDYKRLATACHPDSNPDDTDFAKEVFSLLEQRVGECGKGLVISSKKSSYEVERTPFAKGNIADIYKTKDKKHVLKIVRQPKRNDLAKHEVEVLKKLWVPRKDSEALSYIYPNVIETFMVKGKVNRFVSVYEHDEDLISLTKVREADLHKDGVDDRTFAWMMNRILLGVALTHQRGVLHCGVTPDHFLVNKVNHACRILGFIHSTNNVMPAKIKVQAKNKDYYPHEILNNLTVSKETDVYMAGKTAIFLLGGNVKYDFVPHDRPVEFRNFIASMILPNRASRPDNAMELLDTFKSICRRLFGPPTYHELKGV